MSLDSNVELLQKIPIFRDLTQGQLAAIAAKAKKAFFAKDDYIIKNGDRGDTAYVVLSGRAISQAENMGEDVLLAGTLIGELAMLVDMTYTADVVAAERIRALAITRKGLYEAMNADPRIAEHFSNQLMQRLVDLAEQLRAVDEQFAEIEASLQAAAG